jgi:hypothetical protein
MKQEAWVSLKEISRHLKVSPDTIHRWIRKNRIPAHRVGRFWRFKITEIDDWVHAGKAASTAASSETGEHKEMPRRAVDIPRQRIADFCRANGIRRLALFGSVLRDDFRPDSDVDVLVEFQPRVRVGLSFIRMQDELSAILGRKVDLHTPANLSKYFRDEVLREAETLYVAA